MPNFIPGEGPVPCTHMIIGEAPGAQEEKEGRPFVGKSGQLLRSTLDGVGCSPSRVFITNAYKLRPAENRNPNRAELKSHRVYLDNEFNSVDPISVLLLGRVAFDHVLPWVAGTAMRSAMLGTFKSDEMPGVTFFVNWHPAYVLRNKKVKHEFIAKIAEWANYPLVR